MIFTFAGITLWQISKVKSWGKTAAFLIFSLCFGANLIFVFSFFQFVHKKEQINGDYGLVFRKKEELVQKSIKNFKYHPLESRAATVARVIFSIYYFDQKEGKYLPKKELIPVVNSELRNSELLPITGSF